ncbi:stalk domain-containing protein [Paenibacillus sp. MMS20-IR301]|uniref:copper amine oxidase N-terminal domain-containing protein n=1 Tax=Paenibacillus sp. MMS20-IR301 TaxID=2895946 RepID=UPI0028EAB25A|nr:stalk domain-containing protein [Paenibacillus sp. MMS20-IR301]WNS43227.1 stalk domain-containing protein [Paenibacillus sp. MMS20-IR301]
MKKLLSMIGITLLALMLAVPAFAAEKPIKVYINGTTLSFPAGTPYLKDNTVLVPFRVIFEQLGLQVLWDAKTGTVTGTGATLNISLKVGSKRATVNGTVKQLTVAPVAAAGTTYIPLRFIAEATGGTALWDSASRSVKITVPKSASTDQAEITALIQLSNKYYNEEKAISFYSLVDSESDNMNSVADMNSLFQAYDLKNTIESLKILSLAGDEATVYTVETNIRTGGYYTPDERFEYLYTLVRRNGEWKISDMEVQESTVLLTREAGMKPAVLPQGDAAVIKDTLSKYYQYMGAQNVDATMALMTSYGEDYDAAAKADLQALFDTYDLSYSLGTANIYYYSDDEAAVYTEVSIKDGESGENYTQSLIFIMFKSESGSWTIDDTYHISFDTVQTAQS